MNCEKIAVLIIGASVVLAFIYPLAYYLLSYLKEEISYKKNADKQHLMFNQLKKGNFIWEIYNGELIHHTIESVKYDFFSSGKLWSINIEINPYNIIRLDPDKAKVFKYERYYSLYSEAKATHSIITAKRQKELNEVTNVSPETLKKEADEAIKRIEKIEKEYGL